MFNLRRKLLSYAFEFNAEIFTEMARAKMMRLIEWITENRQKMVNPPHYSQRKNKKQIGLPKDELASRLSLYGYNTCIYCRNVSDVIDQLGISIKIRNTFKYPEYKQDLLIGGGKTSVPCLKITFQYSKELWLYDSTSIIDFLQRSFPQQYIEKRSLES